MQLFIVLTDQEGLMHNKNDLELNEQVFSLNNY